MNNYETVRNFVNSRPGFNSHNYSTAQQWNRDHATATRQKKIALELLELAGEIGIRFEDTTPQGKRGRFFLENGQANYHCGQYYPTEYRAQAAAFLARYITERLQAVYGSAWRNAEETAGLSRAAKKFLFY